MLNDFKALQSELLKAGENHNQKYKSKVNNLIAKIDDKYKQDIEECLFFLKKDNDIFQTLNETYKTIKNIFISNSWVGWELCDFGPVLNIKPIDNFPIAMIAYSAIHLSDDGIYGHKEYKSCNVKSFYGYSLENGKGERESSALSSMMGMAVYNSCIQLLRKKNSKRLLKLYYGFLVMSSLVYSMSPYIQNHWTKVHIERLSAVNQLLIKCSLNMFFLKAYYEKNGPNFSY